MEIYQSVTNWVVFCLSWLSSYYDFSYFVTSNKYTILELNII